MNRGDEKEWKTVVEREDEDEKSVGRNGAEAVERKSGLNRGETRWMTRIEGD